MVLTLASPGRPDVTWTLARSASTVGSATERMSFRWASERTV